MGKTGNSWLIRLLDVAIILAIVIFSSLLMIKSGCIGYETGSVEQSWAIFFIYVLVFGVITFVCLCFELSRGGDYQTLLDKKRKSLKKCVNRLDGFTAQTSNSCKEARKGLSGADYLSNHYVYLGKYYQHRAEFNAKTAEVIKEWKTEAASYLAWGKLWKLLIVIGVITQFMACSYVMGYDMKQDEKKYGEMLPAPTFWNAKNIPLPHLTDGSRYVSNPDSVITPHPESQLNVLLKQMDDSLGIESAVVVVKHVENRDIFGFAQGLFDLYHIGKEDRGLVMVLAYDDHLFRSHTGRALEADLTDAECSQLQQKYLVPSMKAEQPDSGMLYLTQAVYNTLKGKELPHMSTLPPKSSPVVDNEDYIAVGGYYMLILGFWVVMFFWMGRRYGWFLRFYLHNMMTSNMFESFHTILPLFFGGAPSFFSGIFSGGGGGYSSGGSSYSGGGYSSSSSSYHSSGGGYSGGSSGGGGATSSW